MKIEELISGKGDREKIEIEGISIPVSALRSFSHRLTPVASAMLGFFETCNGVNADTHGMRIGCHTRFTGVQS